MKVTTKIEIVNWIMVTVAALAVAAIIGGVGL